MRFKTFAATAVTAGALALATAGPASAAPYWQTVSTNSNWSCTAYRTHPVSTHVNWKLCEVVNANYDAQVVVVVQNTATVAVSITGATSSNYSSDGTCLTSTLNPGFTRGCYGPTRALPAAGSTWHQGQLIVNGVTDTITVYG
ncbi:hypothetical protein [Kitasatospora sp. NPDC051914]|uniref:hypothetical protein n=1 Tax=Kitasatospora sp. NPDC051914 TaxID=3154945 RepID=UPI0034186828